MTEFEVHQLIANSRTEFDLGTVFFVFINLVYIVLAVSKRDLAPFQIRWLCISCGVISTFVIMRIIAAIIRFIDQSRFLESMNPDYTHTFLLLQFPTLIGRLTILFGLPILSIWLLRKNIKH